MRSEEQSYLSYRVATEPAGGAALPPSITVRNFPDLTVIMTETLVESADDDGVGVGRFEIGVRDREGGV